MLKKVSKKKVVSPKIETDYLSPLDLEKQEHLSLEKLQLLHDNLYIQYHFNLEVIEKARPISNFIELMKWAETSFSSKALQDTKNINKFVHNRILIDGPFLQFCKERDVTVKTVYKDSMISWKTENNYEKFFAQGVFLIKHKDFEFLHCALFHKGAQNDDEVSFFILVSDNNYEAYLKLRNDFDEWIQLRDRSNSHIRVVDGEDVPYSKDESWDDLFLSSDLKMDIKNLVENFLSSKDFYRENRIPWKTGVILYGEPGLGKTSLIKTIMANYNFKPVTIGAGATNESLKEAFSYAEEQSPSLLFFEDIDSLLERVDVSAFLNMLDGVSAKNGIFIIATTNYIHKLKPNITARPSRFDRKFEISFPDENITLAYIQKWFKNLLSPQKAKELAKFAVKAELSCAYLKELYISSMFLALSNNRKTPTEKDIETVLKTLIKDKNLLSAKTINTSRYFSK